MRVIADVMPQGSAQVVDGGAIFLPPGASTSIKTVTIPPGSVGLTIEASEYQDAAANGTSCDDPGFLTP